MEKRAWNEMKAQVMTEQFSMQILITLCDGSDAKRKKKRNIRNVKRLVLIVSHSLRLRVYLIKKSHQNVFGVVQSKYV